MRSSSAATDVLDLVVRHRPAPIAKRGRDRVGLFEDRTHLGPHLGEDVDFRCTAIAIRFELELERARAFFVYRPRARILFEPRPVALERLELSPDRVVADLEEPSSDVG